MVFLLALLGAYSISIKVVRKKKGQPGFCGAET